MSKEATKFDWGDETQVTKAPEAPKTSEMPKPSKDDAMKEAISQIRESLKEDPDFDKYMKLIGILLDKRLLDEAIEVTDEFNKWRKLTK